MASPKCVLLFGDYFVARNLINKAKQQRQHTQLIELSLKTHSLDEFYSEIVTIPLWDSGSGKTIILQDLAKDKESLDTLLEICNNIPDNTLVIVFDNKNIIKINPKTGSVEKAWTKFVSSFKKLPDAKVKNCGAELTEKNKDDALDFVISAFKNNNISDSDAELLIQIVGRDRGLLQSEIDKLCILAPSPVTTEFIIENAFATSKEAILYKLDNVLDNGSYYEALEMAEEFVGRGINENVLATTIMKRVRWQLAAAHFFYDGCQFHKIPYKLMEMGKFPSDIWHDDSLSLSDKNAYDFDDIHSMVKYLNQEKGIPISAFKPELLVKPKPKILKSGKVSKAKPKVVSRKSKAEKINWDFHARQIVNHLEKKIVNRQQVTSKLKEKVLNRALNVYLQCHERLVNIRTNAESAQKELSEMIRLVTDCTLEG